MDESIFKEFNTDGFTSLFPTPTVAETPLAPIAEDPDGGEAEEHIRVKKTISRHTMRRVLSEVNLEKELPWHFEDGVSYHCFSWGDVDSLTYFRAVVKQQHINYALISTWCMAMEDCTEIESWLAAGYIDRVDFYIGEIFKASYYPEYVKLVEICAKYGGRVCMFRNHSKVMVLLGERFAAVIEASANVNTNPRSEQTCITVDRDLALWYKGIFDGVRSFERIFDNVMPYAEEESKPL